MALKVCPEQVYSIRRALPVASTRPLHALKKHFPLEHAPFSQCATALRIVDFGPGTDVNYAFTAQTVMNPLGKSPPMCSEF